MTLVDRDYCPPTPPTLEKIDLDDWRDLRSLQLAKLDYDLYKKTLLKIVPATVSILILVALSFLPIIPHTGIVNSLRIILFLASTVGIVLSSLGMLDFEQINFCNKYKAAGIAGPAAFQALKDIAWFNNQVELLNRFSKTKTALGLENDEAFELHLQKKVRTLSVKRGEIMQRLSLLEKLWGIQEGELDNFSDIFLDAEPEAVASTQEMLSQSIRKLSARVTIEDELLEDKDVLPIESAKRLHKEA